MALPTSTDKFSDFNPLIVALKKLFLEGVDFVKALVEVVIQLFQLIIDFVRAGLSLLS